jgi:hypothetical protein
MLDNLTSPAKALAQQANMEARVEAVLLSQLSKFLDSVLIETLNSRRYVSGAFYADEWTRFMGAVALSRRLPVEVAEYIAVTLADSPTPDEAWSSAMSVLSRSSEQAWSLAEEEVALRAALSMESGETFLTAAAPVVKRDDDGKPIYRRTANLDEGGISWVARMRRDARTAVTGLYGDLATEQMERAGAITKRWVTRRDERVREPHAAADGQTVPLDQPFIVDGFAMRYPGDRNAPAYLTINCRCVTVTGDEMGQFANQDFAAMLAGQDQAALEAWMGGVGREDALVKFDTIRRTANGDYAIEGYFRDENGNALGRFSRVLYLSDGSVEHKELFLAESARRQGIATEFNARMEEMYRQLGLDRIEVEAGLEDGGYVWAKAGFDWRVTDDGFAIYNFNDKLEQATGNYMDDDEVTEYLDHLYLAYADVEKAQQNYEMGRGSVEDIAAALANMPKPEDIANASFPGAPNLGAELLRGTQWNGVKPL